MSNALAGQGRIAEAIDMMERSVGVVRRLPYFLALLGQWYGRGGRRDEALGILDELKESPQCSASWLALVCCGLKDPDNAFRHLDQAIDEHDDQCQVTFLARRSPVRRAPGRPALRGGAGEARAASRWSARRLHPS